MSDSKKLTITFRFKVYSMLNVLVDRFNIEAMTRDEAWLKARKKQRGYPSQVILKIS
jgi:hypothetical protein